MERTTMTETKHLHQQQQPHLVLSRTTSRQQQQQQPPRCTEWIFRDVPSDITIQVNGTTFSLHKFPLVSRSGRIRKLISTTTTNSPTTTTPQTITLHNLPGGPETFTLATKFCYGINFEIHPTNVAQLICTTHYLEMFENYSKDNLHSRTNEYLTTIITNNLEMSIQVLKQCETLLPLADELGIVTKCTEAVAAKACVEQIKSSFSRLEYSGSGRLHMTTMSKDHHHGSNGDWWLEDISVLRIDMYERVVIGMKCRGVRCESIATSLIKYVEKELSNTRRRGNLYDRDRDHHHHHISETDSDSTTHEKVVVETIVNLLPTEKLTIVPVTFLFGLLRSAILLDCSTICRHDLERRIGSQLELATLDDLLIPTFRRHSSSSSSDHHNNTTTVFDVDTVNRLIIKFTQQEGDSTDDDEDDPDDDDGFESDQSHDHHHPRHGRETPSQSVMIKVGKLIDSYLSEIASDVNLKLSTFLNVAESLPSHARIQHDGIYRAIDVYFKAHIGLTDTDKKRLCKLIDFQKLTPETVSHAAQNDRLPLQSIVQVLYFEQLRLRNSLQHSTTYIPEEEDDRLTSSVYSKPSSMYPPTTTWRVNSGALSASMSPKDNYASLRRENRELKLELVRLRMRLNDLEKDHVCMKRNIERNGSGTSRKFFMMRKFSRRFFGGVREEGSESRGSSSPPLSSKVLGRTESKITGRTY